METRERRWRILQGQIVRLERRAALLQRESDRLTRWRLLSFLAIFVVGAVVLLTWGPPAWVVSVVVLAIPFAVSVARHRRVERALRRLGAWRAWKATQVARMTLDWEHLPATRPLPPRLDHPFALDLDLLGERSMLHLLDTAVAQQGSDRLRDWLLETQPDPARTRRRQDQVRELRHLSHFREHLQLHATLAGGGDDSWSAATLLEWLLRHTTSQRLRPVLIALVALVPVNLALLLLNLNGSLPPLWIGTWALYGLLTILQMNRVGPVFQDAAYLNDSLQRLGGVFGFLERFPYAGRPALGALCMPFQDAAQRPTAHLRRVRRVVAAAGLRYNPFIAFLLNVFVPWDVYVAYRLDQLKAQLQALLPTWLDVWFELEALCSLANFGFLNPEATFAHVQAEETAVPLDAIALGHPLISAEQRVCNDFRAEALGEIAIITGSNMAGKSSFLRALGVNVVLGLAGGPVLAQSLTLQPLRLYASIRVTDSVTDGFSFFYAEVRRLRALLDALQQPDAFPLLFLIDEIFRGTNNRERLIGSRSYVRALVGGRGVGAIATHDLELVQLARGNDLVRNFHFRDAVENGRMVFDYTLRPGPCPTTNALKIMRLAGLPVEDSG